jgi:hypothetical protein
MMFDNLDVSWRWPDPEPTPLQEEVVISQRGLESLQGEWRWLWARCAGATTAQRPEWLLPWCRRRADPSSSPLWVLTLRSEGRLAGLVPLTLRLEQGARVVRLLGEGLPGYLDVLMDAQLAPRGMLHLFDWLARCANQWDTCAFTQLREGSQLLRAPLPPGWGERIDAGELPSGSGTHGRCYQRGLWLAPAKAQ